MLNNFIKEDIQKLNTMTKYPSIPTYHKLGNKGMLTEELQYIIKDITTSILNMSEKIDGTNVRIILYGDDYIIGSREDLLYAKGDRIINKSMDIVENTIHIADKLSKPNTLQKDDYIFVFYGELYGGTVGKNNKRYSNDKSKFGFKLFDGWSMKINDFINLFKNNTVSQLSSWRDKMGQPFISTFGLKYITDDIGLEKVPDIGYIEIQNLPTSIDGMYEFLKRSISDTNVGLTETKNSKAEGFVLRSEDRRFITKIRYEDYERTIRRRQ